MAEIVIPKRTDIIQEDGLGTLRFHKWMERVSANQTSTEDTSSVLIGLNSAISSISRLEKRIKDLEKLIY